MTDTPQSVTDLPVPPDGREGWPWTEASDDIPDVRPDGTPWPRISIVTPNYNQGAFIEETIRSVLLQNYPNLEYIVIDGGSDDQTVEILEKYDPWIDHWISEPDDGQSDAINKGFEAASGEIFAWLNSDDYYAEGVLHAVAPRFEQSSHEVGAVVGTGHKINDAGEIVYTPAGSDLTYEAFLNWLDGGSFMQPACFFRREAWSKCGPLRTDLRYSMDVDLWLKMVQHYRFERIERTLSYAHKHGDAKTTGERQRWRAETILRLAVNGGYNPAHKEAMKMADELSSLRSEVRSMNKHPVFKWAMRVWRHLIT